MINRIKSLKIILLKVLSLASKFLTRLGYLILSVLVSLVKIAGFFLQNSNRSVKISYQKRLKIFLYGVRKLRKRIKQNIRRSRRLVNGRVKKASKVTRAYAKPLRRARPFILGVAFALVFIAIPWRVYLWYQELPDPQLLAVKGNNRSTRILDRNGHLLYEIYHDRRYDPVALEQIPLHMIESTLAIEDSEFYNHIGFRPSSIVRAAKANILHDDLQGGSTITQQLVKNVLLTPERTVERKLKELVLSYLVEHKYTKEEILELYFNNIPYGGTAWGVQSASQKYFGKDVWDLTLAEASLLSGLPSAPSAYSPLDGNLEVAKYRQKLVLNRMVFLGYIDKEEADTAYSEELVFAPQTDYIRAPHFVFYVRSELERLFGARYVDFGGLTVVTTLDLSIQEEAQRIVREEIEKSVHMDITNGAAVVLDPETGEILAYVGSKNYFQDEWGAYDVLTSYRQPGSAIKPVTYSLAFSEGLTPATIIEDSPIVFRYEGQVYRPVNYDRRFHGRMTLRTALANSYNIPAVKLVNALGPDNMVELGHRMGLSDWQANGGYGVSVTLGGKDVRPLDLANVYATLARGGIYKDTTPFVSIKDINGRELYRGNGYEEKVIEPEVAYIVTDILSDYYARIPMFGTSNLLSVRGHTVAVKTGTTDQKRDNLAYGYTPSYVLGVWVGNNDNSPMNRYLTSGLSGATPIWHRIMSFLLEEKENEPFGVPDGILVRFDPECNRREVFVRGTAIPDTLCISVSDDDEEDEEGEEDEHSAEVENRGRGNQDRGNQGRGV